MPLDFLNNGELSYNIINLVMVVKMRILKVFFFIYVILLSVDLYGITPEAKEKIRVIHSFFKKTEFAEVSELIIAQAVLETGWFSSDFHNEWNNYWSVKNWKDPQCKTVPIRCLMKNKNIHGNIRMMYRYLQRKKYSNNFEGYLYDLKKNYFAEDPLYNKKLRAIVKSLRKRNLV